MKNKVDKLYNGFMLLVLDKFKSNKTSNFYTVYRYHNTNKGIGFKNKIKEIEKMVLLLTESEFKKFVGKLMIKPNSLIYYIIMSIDEFDDDTLKKTEPYFTGVLFDYYQKICGKLADIPLQISDDYEIELEEKLLKKSNILKKIKDLEKELLDLKLN